MPRPFKNPEDRKTHHLRIPVNETQRELIEQAVGLEERDFAEWARTILLDVAKRVIKKHGSQDSGDKA
jgi:uncharacterized protein (DUF1778 family)